MYTIELLLFLVLGFSVGSFLNVLIYRIPKRESILGRSYCDNCKKKLLWYDLIPLVSFVYLKGKCRFCKRKINFSIPLIELATAILFVLTFLKFPIIADFNLWFFLFFLSSLIVIFFTDLEDGIIPDKIIFPLFFLSLIYTVLTPNLLSHFLSFVIVFITFLLIDFLTRGKGLGLGDVKLMAIFGLIFGFPKVIIPLYLAFLTGAIVSLILVLWGKKRFHEDTIPFGPFLVIGGIIGVFMGEQLVSLLLSFW